MCRARRDATTLRHTPSTFIYPHWYTSTSAVSGEYRRRIASVRARSRLRQLREDNPVSGRAYVESSPLRGNQVAPQFTKRSWGVWTESISATGWRSLRDVLTRTWLIDTSPEMQKRVTVIEISRGSPRNTNAPIRAQSIRSTTRKQKTFNWDRVPGVLDAAACGPKSGKGWGKGGVIAVVVNLVGKPLFSSESSNVC